MPPTLTSQHLHGAAVSSFIGAVFALVWGLNGSFALAGSWRTLVAAIVVLVTFGMAFVSLTFYRRAKQFPPGPETLAPNPFRTTVYRVAVAAMLIALPVVSRVLTLNGQGDATMPAVAIVVGLHFLGLVRAFRSGVFVWLAGGFCLVGFGALFLPVGEPNALEPRHAAVGLGCALVLWLGALPIIVKTFRQLGLRQGT